MRYFILMIVLVACSPAGAADLTCTLPAAYIPRAIELCEELRVRMHVRLSDWSNDVCASAFLRTGLLEGDRKSTRRGARRSVAQAVNDAVDSFNINYPRVAAQAACGDTILDAEFGEQCDDGNTTPLDGCNASCLIEQ